MESAGGTALCPPMGAAAKASRFDWSPLRGKRVIVVADRDQPGRRHASQVAELLAPVAASLKIVEAAQGKDAADHIAVGHSLDELVPAGQPGDDGDRGVGGAELLDELHRFAGRFLVFPTPPREKILWQLQFSRWSRADISFAWGGFGAICG